MSSTQAQPQCVRIAVWFDRGSIVRTGLRMGKTFPVVSVEDAPREGFVWVQCPPQEIERDGVTIERSPGYVLLEPSEYEVVS